MARQIDLGAATEQRITDAFAKRALISTAQAAVLLGLDRRVVQRLAAGGEIGSTVEGADKAGKERRLFAERHIRTFLEGKSEWAFTDQSDETGPPANSRKRRISTSISPSAVGDFTDRRARKPAAPQKPSSGANAKR
jgi:hypothetical protein